MLKGFNVSLILFTFLICCVCILNGESDAYLQSIFFNKYTMYCLKLVKMNKLWSLEDT